MPSLGVLGILVSHATLFKSLIHQTFLHIEAWGLGGGLLGPLESWRPPGRLRGCLWDASGRVWEASGRRLWGPWGHLGRLGGQDALKKSQGRPRSPPKTRPRGPRWPPRASERKPQRPPRGPKRTQKHNKSNITSENCKNLKNDDPVNKNQ